MSLGYHSMQVLQINIDVVVPYHWLKQYGIDRQDTDTDIKILFLYMQHVASILRVNYTRT